MTKIVSDINNNSKEIIFNFLRLKIRLTTGMLGHVSQISTQRISIYIFLTIKVSSREYKHVWFTIILAWLFVHTAFSEVTKLDEGVKVITGRARGF